eukprot:10882962-Ditylum_brightwellii.AAC.1
MIHFKNASFLVSRCWNNNSLAIVLSVLECIWPTWSVLELMTVSPLSCLLLFPIAIVRPFYYNIHIILLLSYLLSFFSDLAVANIAAATVSTAAASTKLSTVMFAAITTNPTKPRPPTATEAISAAACTAFTACTASAASTLLFLLPQPLQLQLLLPPPLALLLLLLPSDGGENMA